MLFRSATFDVALVDVSMPEMDGWELMERLRDLDPALPVIIMSGYVDPERVREHQPAAVVAKPYEARALADTVARVIAEHPRP